MPRPRKNAHIYRRPGRASWYAYISKTHRDISLDTEDEAEAHTKLAALLDAGGLRAVSEGRRTVAETFEACIERARTNHARKYTYESARNLARILRWLAERDVHALDEITPELVETYKASRRATKSRRTGQPISAARINAELISWRKAMALAVENGDAPPAVLASFMKLREPRPLPNRQGLTKAELLRFLRAEKDPGYRSLFRVALGTGLRDDELRHMDASDIRPPHVVVTPKDGWNTKGYRYRSIPATEATLKAARDFVRRRGELVLDQKAVWSRIQEVRKAAKIDRRFSMHDLRRAYASHLLAAGYRIEQISQWLGHAELTTTLRYLRVVDGGEIDTSKMVF